jgi:hypothetical protein
MVTSYKIKFSVVIYILFAIVLVAPQKSVAQRFSHASMGGGGGSRPSAPAFHAAAPPPVSRPAPTFNRPPAAAPANNRSINGGSWNNGNHDLSRNNVQPQQQHVVATRPAVVQVHPADVHANRNVNVHENVNVYHSRNQAYQPYSYHPYHPYHWGPSWHPIGFFAATLAADAYLFSLANQQYYYDDGVYYEPSSNGYSVVSAPIGAVVSSLPDGYETVQVGDDYFYYYGGTFYIATDQGYQVVTAPYGAVVTDIPDGAVEQDINGDSFYVYNNTYYEPVSQGGEDAYQVVQVN